MNKKKLSILTLVLAILLVLSYVGMFVLSEACVILVLYFLAGFVISGIVLWEWKDGHEPRLILIGIVVMYIALVFLGIAEKNKDIAVTLSTIYFCVGFDTLIKGIKKRRDKKRGIIPLVNQNVSAEPVFCARCGKNMALYSSSEICEIDGVKYCAKCKREIKVDIKNQHTVCRECGVDLPKENMHLLDGKMICHNCFLKKVGNFNYDDEEE